MKLTPKAKWASILCIALVALAMLALWQSKFSSSRWRSADLMTQTRNRMVPDLIKSRTLVGKSRAQVTELLGPVTETDKFADWDMVYVLGPQDGYIDHEWLVLRTDKRGAVIEQKVVGD